MPSDLKPGGPVGEGSIGFGAGLGVGSFGIGDMAEPPTPWGRGGEEPTSSISSIGSLFGDLICAAEESGSWGALSVRGGSLRLIEEVWPSPVDRVESALRTDAGL
eukprot:CAMPEP_0184301742 /NCGR_PEP_ID=MMETSP1049-20130417/11873_1 /TAXON_ID=77928 /ORGANISM="Proteomonas sulcata, Strain CCMP704" /LENGTH=104 /DNA_ID=CAMNT_0026612821 /DNA_START=211 /DNA_END=526 /DNA_ORIENTATION=-